MARGGFLGRIGRAIRNIVAPPRPSPPPEPPPEPPAPPPRHDFYRDIWRAEKEGRRGSYRGHRAIFDRMMRDVGEDNPDELFDLWRTYVQHMVNKGSRRNSTSNLFWRESGIDPTDFDWAAWRSAMNYKRGK